MNQNRKKIWVVTTGAALILCLIWLARPERIPVSQGQPLNVWFDQLSQKRTVAETEQIKAAFKTLGPTAVPFLVNRLHVRDSSWKSRYRDFYSTAYVRWPRWLVSRLPSPSLDNAFVIRMNALTALGWLETAALPAAPDLAAALYDEFQPVRFSAAQLLKALGPAAHETLPLLLGVLQATNAALADNAIGVVASVGRESPEIIPPLRVLLREPDEVKIRSLQVLSRLGEPALAAEPDMTLLLASTNLDVKAAALTALWGLAPSRHLELFPEMEAFARSPLKKFRLMVGIELLQMQPLTPQAGELLAELIRKGDDDFCWSAFTTLRRRGREASNATPALLAGLEAENPRIAAKAAEVLGDIGEPEDPVIRGLEQAQHHEHLMVSDAARESMVRLQSRVLH